MGVKTNGSKPPGTDTSSRLRDRPESAAAVLPSGSVKPCSARSLRQRNDRLEIGGVVCHEANRLLHKVGIYIGCSGDQLRDVQLPSWMHSHSDARDRPVTKPAAIAAHAML
jgi:hypothetical protein